MRIVLHIGMPKAGSSALQGALTRARGALRRKGVLYPKTRLNHNFLIAGLAPPDRMGRLFQQHYDGDADAIRADFADFWGGIVDSVRREAPSTVVLSSEFLFGAVGEAGGDALRALLAPLGGSTEIICYVRRPSDYYLSMAQQRLKASWVIRPVEAIGYRRSLEAALVAAERVHAVPYDRSLFPDGDVVADFAARFMPEAAADLRAVTDLKVKPSMSAEAMAIVQAYRRSHHPDENDRFTPDTGQLVRRLGEREAELGGRRRPELLPHVRDHIDQSSVDLLWLRDTFGIVFDGIDYVTIAARAGLTPESVDEICVVDPERRRLLEPTAESHSVPLENPAKRRRFRSLFLGRRRR
ncbi:MAG TPA: hypothetical protein VFK86_07980 [Bauldia sp.]|nr:hypothetical protein [Bauldia sp.]